MSGVFVSGTGTEIGKTEVSCRLIAALRRQGVEVVPRKPVVSGFGPPFAATDPGRLMQAAGWPESRLDEVAPHRFTAPLAPGPAAAAEGRRFGFEDFLAGAAGTGFRVVEGVGGLMVPLDERRTVLDAVLALDLPLLIVAGTYLGTLSHTLTAWSALRARSEIPARVVLSESLEAPMSSEACADALQAHLGHRPFLIPRQGDGDVDELAGWCRRMSPCGFNGH